MSRLETALHALSDLDRAITKGEDTANTQAALDHAVRELNHDEFIEYVSAAVSRSYPEPPGPERTPRRILSPEIANAVARNRANTQSIAAEH